MEALMRSVLLSMARSERLGRLARRYGLRFGASRFVAGETLEDAIQAVSALNAAGIAATLDHLGEFVRDADEARASAEECVQVLNAIRESGVHATLSVKLTQLGLDIDPKLCLENMRRILSVAEEHGIWVTIDMEDYGHCAVTLDLFETLHREFSHVGTVIQAYLYRSLEDLARLSAQGCHLRIVKGAYKESPEVAYPDKKDVDANYLRLMETQLKSSGFTAIATHDENIIDHAKRFIAAQRIPKDRYEFQMLYGIKPQLQARLVEEGYPLRLYVPYGTDWYGYFMRRLAERPANVAFVLKGLFN
ncbi:MAG: proline dehydrogenase [Thermoflavifilum sp.]|nr:proline dehydrogenase [Thermoflavifilum sp.]MCL6513656.1 proline dehydrogenase [Alicyclobacillus sp.]